MVRFTGGLLLFTALSTAAPSQHHEAGDKAQQVLRSPLTSQATKPRKLQGRFLHITDIHPDPFYEPGTDPNGNHPCHAGDGQPSAGYYGAPITACDSPFSLVDATFEWIKENIRDDIDFVVWTGDSARHDNDRDIPRSTKQVEKLNRFVVDKFVETFGKTDNLHDPDPTNDFVIPIIPTFGNNDVVPHNIFKAGPNKWTRKFIDIWQKFVPEDQYHSFERGGWFFTEVIPNKLAVFSLNTLYFFDNNVAVDGCDDPTEPGYEHMEWLRIQLQFLRARGMKAIISGHVPPANTESKQSWDETCFQKYTLWLRQYRDVIVGSLYGHMNVDHFMFHDVRDLTYKFKIDGIDDENLRPKHYPPNPIPNDEFSANDKVSYLNDLRASWADLPTPPKGISYALAVDHTSGIPTSKQTGNQKEREKFLKDIGGSWGERFSLSLVSPSVVPKYFPTLRIIEYNITGLEHSHAATGAPQGTPAEDNEILLDLELKQHQNHDQSYKLRPELELQSGLESKLELEADELEPPSSKKKKHKKKKHQKPRPKFRVPKPPSSTSPPGPAYSPQTFTFLSLTQLYANLTEIHEAMTPSTPANDDQATKDASPAMNPTTNTTNTVAKNHFAYKVEYTTNNDSKYHLHDLTIRSWLDIAERMGRKQLHPSTSSAHHDSFLPTDGDDDLPFRPVPIKTTSHKPGHDPSLLAETNTKQQAGDDVESVSKKHKHRHKNNGKLSDNHLWHAFVKRAYVYTRADADLEQDFG